MVNLEGDGIEGKQGRTIAKDSTDEILANYRKIVGELTQCIGQNVPRKHWPEFVERYYVECMAEIMGNTKSINDGPKGSKPRVKWDDQPLGKVPDVELAKRLGVSDVAVGRARRRRKIPPCNYRNGCYRPRGQRAGINWDEQPLGEIPDVELAKRLGVHASSVRSARSARGIAPEPPKRSRRPKRAAKKNKFSERELRVRRKKEIKTPPDDSIPKGPHVHRCPTCRQDTPCKDELCEPILDNEDGIPMIYKTCKVCIDTLANERNAEMVTVGTPSARFGPMGRFR